MVGHSATFFLSQEECNPMHYFGEETRLVHELGGREIENQNQSRFGTMAASARPRSETVEYWASRRHN